MKKKLKNFLRKINIIRHTCDGLVGKKHKFFHRACIGIVVMVVGVVIVKTIGHSANILVSACGDLVGLSLHGIGLIPFVEALLEDIE